MANIKSAGKILDARTGQDVELHDMIEGETVKAQVAMLILEARTKRGLTQSELADLVNTKQPVIARLEDADYEGHSLSLLKRIADQLGMRLEIRMIDKSVAS